MWCHKISYETTELPAAFVLIISAIIFIQKGGYLFFKFCGFLTIFELYKYTVHKQCANCLMACPPIITTRNYLSPSCHYLSTYIKAYKDLIHTHPVSLYKKLQPAPSGVNAENQSSKQNTMTNRFAKIGNMLRTLNCSEFLCSFPFTFQIFHTKLNIGNYIFFNYTY